MSVPKLVIAHKQPTDRQGWTIQFCSSVDMAERFKKAGADVQLYTLTDFGLEKNSPEGKLGNSQFGDLSGLFSEACFKCSYMNKNANDSYRCYTNTCPDQVLSTKVLEELRRSMGWL